MGKEAVVVIIDVNETMSRPIRAEEPDKSRLDCAKEVAIAMVSDLLIRSNVCSEVRWIFYLVLVLGLDSSANLPTDDYLIG